jgi:hypothetical protein
MRSAWRTRSVCGQFREYSARHRRGRNGHDLDLRACILSIASYADRPLCFHRPLMPKISTKPLIFGVGAHCSLTRIIHLPNDEIIQLRHAVDIAITRAYQLGSKSQISTASPYPARLTPMNLATKPTKLCLSWLLSSMTACAICLVQLCPGQPHTFEDCAEHRIWDQPNSYSTTSGQYDQEWYKCQLGTWKGESEVVS